MKAPECAYDISVMGRKPELRVSIMTDRAFADMNRDISAHALDTTMETS